ncbi:MAG: helix-turn-helix domain-containing protein [Pseudonocardiaceae bacterium]
MDRKRERLVELRKIAGYTQGALADELAVDRSTVARWEGGLTEPQPEQRRRLANALGVSFAELAAVLDDVGNGDEIVSPLPNGRVESPPSAAMEPGDAGADEQIGAVRVSRRRLIAMIAVPAVLLVVAAIVVGFVVTRNASTAGTAPSTGGGTTLRDPAALLGNGPRGQAATGSYEGAYAEIYPYEVTKICDTQSDGNGAYVTVKRADGVDQNFWDGTGHDQYCGGPFYPNSEIVQFNVCEHHTGCTGWRNVAD